eukprot:m.197560 g.197560  ORF g.197560 m.197560 type:complete len:697 (+) comp20166_c0_seq1:260-2350(+)
MQIKEHGDDVTPVHNGPDDGNDPSPSTTTPAKSSASTLVPAPSKPTDDHTGTSPHRGVPPPVALDTTPIASAHATLGTSVHAADAHPDDDAGINTTASSAPPHHSYQAIPPIHTLPPVPIELAPVSANPSKRARLDEEHVGATAEFSTEAGQATAALLAMMAPVYDAPPAPAPPPAPRPKPQFRTIKVFERYEIRDSSKWNDQLWKAHRDGHAAVRAPIVPEFATDAPTMRRLLDAYDLRFIAVVTSTPDASETTVLPSTVDSCTSEVRAQLTVAAQLGAVAAVVTIEGDWWPHADCVAAVRAVNELSAEIGVAVWHSTSSRGLLGSPWVCRAVLDEVPTARVCVDFAAWCRATGRCFASEGADAAWWPSALELVSQRTDALDVSFDHSLNWGHPADPAAEDDLTAFTYWWQAVVARMGRVSGEQAAVMVANGAMEEGGVACTEAGSDPHVYVAVTHAPYTMIPGSKIPVVRRGDASRWLQQYIKRVFNAACPTGVMWQSEREVTKISLTPSPVDEPVVPSPSPTPEPKEPDWFLNLESIVNTGDQGTLVVQTDGPIRRIVYMARNNETPIACAAKLQQLLPALTKKTVLNRLIAANKVYHKGLFQKSKLRKKTVLVLPLEDTDEVVDNHATVTSSSTALTNEMTTTPHGSQPTDANEATQDTTMDVEPEPTTVTVASSEVDPLDDTSPAAATVAS